MGNFIQSIEEVGYRARADRRFQSGRVVDTDPITHSAIVDVGATRPDGTPVYMHGIGFSPQSPPKLGDMQSLLYTNSSPHSPTGGGMAVGANAPSQQYGNGGVLGVSKSGSTILKDFITFTGTGGITLSQVGQNIAVDGSGLGGTPATTVTEVSNANAVGVSTNYAREDHAHRGVHGLSAHGLAALYGLLTIAGAGGITPSQLGNEITLDGSGVAGTGVSVEVNGAGLVGPNTTLNLVPGTNMASIVAAIVAGVLKITFNASGGSGISGLAAQHNGVAVATEATYNFKDGTYFTWDLIDHAGTVLDVNIVDANVSAFTGDLFKLGGAYHAPVGLKYVYIDNGTNSPAGVTMPTLKTGGPIAHEVTITNDNSGSFTLTAASTETIEQLGGTYANTFTMVVGSRHVFVGVGGASSDGIWRKVV